MVAFNVKLDTLQGISEPITWLVQKWSLHEIKLQPSYNTNLNTSKKLSYH